MGIVFSCLQHFSRDKHEAALGSPANAEGPHLKPSPSSSATNIQSLSDIPQYKPIVDKTFDSSANPEDPQPPEHSLPPSSTPPSSVTLQYESIVDITLASSANPEGEEEITYPQPQEDSLPLSYTPNIPPLSLTPPTHEPMVSCTLDSSTNSEGEEGITHPNPSEHFNHADPLPSSSIAHIPFSCTMAEPCSKPDHTRRFALIIGIDNYINVTKLRGAAADAKAMKEYLKDVFQVPEDHIRTLLDGQATRSAIIQAFKDLKEDKRINNGDPIVVFFAGHGGERPTPRGWGSDSKIQCLYPQDFRPVSNESIPDRTIGVLIQDIAKEKGDNITVILDCCHSASGTRDPDKLYVPRIVYLDLSIHEDLDKNIWAPRAGSIAKGFAYHGLRSHVLLAACGEGELAYERDGRGLFTRELIERLRSHTFNDLTYTELIERIPLEKQNPQCEGVNRHRVLFDTRVPAGRRVYHRADVGDGKCTIHAGLAHGISVGVEFTLYSDRKLRLGVVRVGEHSLISHFETTVTTSTDLSNVSFAKVARIGKVPLYLTPGGNHSVLEERLRQIEAFDSNSQQFGLVNAKEAKMEVAMENNRIAFNVLDQRARSFGLTKLPNHATLDTLPHILDAAAHFFWYHDLQNNRFGTVDKVTVNFYPLKKEYDDFGMPYRVPIEPGFCQKDPNSDNSHIIDFVVDEKTVYGIEIKNNTPRDLYLNAFLFNNSSLSIVPYYTQSSAGNAEAPLKQGGSFTIGYGSGGVPPFSYTLEKGQDVDVGYLKIFFATRPIDLTDIEQMSPFLDIHPPLVGDARDGGPITESERIDIWFTIQIPIVQRRKLD